MSISETLLKEIQAKIQENSPSFTNLEIDDSSLSDEDIQLITSSFPKDSHINRISIKSHSLSSKSYDYFLELIKLHPNITSFYCKLNKPNVSIAMFNEAINRVLAGNILNSKKEKSAVADTVNSHITNTSEFNSGRKNEIKH